MEGHLKEASVDAMEISNLFRSFPFEKLESIKWIPGFDYSNVQSDFAMIAEDIFYGKQNTLR